MKYIYNNEIVEVTLPEQGYRISTDINDKDVHISLTNKQLTFYKKNPEASVIEIWNCKLSLGVQTETIQSITPEVQVRSLKLLKTSVRITSSTNKVVSKRIAELSSDQFKIFSDLVQSIGGRSILTDSLNYDNITKTCFLDNNFVTVTESNFFKAAVEECIKMLQ